MGIDIIDISIYPSLLAIIMLNVGNGGVHYSNYYYYYLIWNAMLFRRAVIV